MANYAETCLATYGTLAPGRVNHKELASLQGKWLTGHVRGHLIEEGWGAEHGYPGIILDEKADMVEVFLFQSEDLPAHWPRLDAFEGDGYTRVSTFVETEQGPLEAYIYSLRQGHPSSEMKKDQQ